MLVRASDDALNATRRVTLTLVVIVSSSCLQAILDDSDNDWWVARSEDGTRIGKVPKDYGESVSVRVFDTLCASTARNRARSATNVKL